MRYTSGITKPPHLCYQTGVDRGTIISVIHRRTYADVD